MRKFDILVILCFMLSPVFAEVVQFKAVLNGSRVELKWFGVGLTDDYTYVVQRSKDGQVFKDLALLRSGATMEFVEFLDVDTKPMKGTSYYRVKQVGVLGDESFSEISVIQNVKKKEKLNETVTAPVLVVAEDLAGESYFGKVHVTRQNPELLATDLEDGFPSGAFRIVATSNDAIRNFMIRIE
jgi:hypothetical protein